MESEVQTKNQKHLAQKNANKPDEEEKEFRTFDESDIALLNMSKCTCFFTFCPSSFRLAFGSCFCVFWNQGIGPYSRKIMQMQADIQKIVKNINETTGFCDFGCVVICLFVGGKESDTGLPAPIYWDLIAEIKNGCKKIIRFQVFQKNKKIEAKKYPQHKTIFSTGWEMHKIINPNTEDAKYVINIKQVVPVFFYFLGSLTVFVFVCLFFCLNFFLILLIPDRKVCCCSGWQGGSNWHWRGNACWVSCQGIISFFCSFVCRKELSVCSSVIIHDWLLHFSFSFFSFFRVDRNKYQIPLPFPAKIDASVTMVQV